MKKIDAHQHFWKFDPVRDSWITGEMAVIQKDFLPDELETILKKEGWDGSVVIQSGQVEEENVFQLNNAADHDFIEGVVGWVDFRDAGVQERLAYYTRFEKMKGFRHILQDEKQRDYMLDPAFKRGIGFLEPLGFTYDILIFPDQLDFTKQFIASFPHQPFVIDHIAKPYIKKGIIEEWKKDIEAIARYGNVYCKLSGMVTEADWHRWTPADFTPYMEVVLEAFGTGRVMYGSDWPVCLLAASYAEQLSVVRNYVSGLSDDEQAAILGGNAIRFYKLNG